MEMKRNETIMEKKIKANYIASQQKNQKKVHNQEFIENIAFIQGQVTFAPAVIETLNVLGNIAATHKYIFPSQQYIADLVGITRKHANRVTTKLMQRNIIKKISQGRQEDDIKSKSCLYVLHPMFKDFKVREALKDILPFCKYIPLFLLFTTGILSFFGGWEEIQSRNVPLLYLNTKYNSTTTTNYTNLLTISTIKDGYRWWSDAFKEWYWLQSNSCSVVDKNSGDIRPILDDLFKTTTTPTIPPTITNNKLSDDAYRREIMQALRDTLPAYVLDIKEVELTDWGRVKLAAFPQAAVEYARIGIKSVRSSNKFGAFYNLCRNWCSQYNVRPDWSIINEFKELYNFSDNDPVVIESFLKPHKRESDYSSTTHSSSSQDRGEYVIPVYPVDRDPHDMQTDYFYTREAFEDRKKEREDITRAKAQGKRIVGIRECIPVSHEEKIIDVIKKITGLQRGLETLATKGGLFSSILVPLWQKDILKYKEQLQELERTHGNGS